jgi:uncharacterized protein
MNKACLAVLLLSFVVSAQSFGGNLRVEEVEFVSHGATLSGSIVFPADQPLHAAVVFIHGSGKQTRNTSWAERFAREGIVALVYDKRGAGKSGGQYEGEQSVGEKNIALLADDAASALKKLSSHPSVFCSRASGTTTWTPRLPRRLLGSSDSPMFEGVASKK